MEYHVPIMLSEVIRGLDIKEGGVYFDGTAGGGGHSFGILSANASVKLIATDKDGDAVAEAEKRLAPFSRRKAFGKSTVTCLIWESLPIR